MFPGLLLEVKLYGIDKISRKTVREVEKQCTLEMLSRLHGTNETWRLDRFKIGRERGGVEIF